MGSSLHYILKSEVADDVIAFLRNRGEKAHIVAPDWVYRRVMSAKSPASSGAAKWSEVVNGPGSEDKSNIVAITDDVAQEAMLMAEVRDRQGSRGFGLYSHVLPALLCNCNGMAPGRPTAGLKRYALLCIPRSGSRYLAAVLANRGIGAPREHIREPLANVITDGGLGFGPAIEALEKFGQRNGIFGTKLISTFLIKASSRRLTDIEANIAWMLARGYGIVRLERSLKDAVVSSYIAFLMKKWHFFGEMDADSRAKLDSLTFEGGAALEEYIRFRAEKIVIDTLAITHGLPTIRYEEIGSGIDDVIDRICHLIRTEGVGLPGGAARTPLPTRSESPTYGRFAEKLDELLQERDNELEPRTIRKLRSLTSLGRKQAEMLVAEASAREAAFVPPAS